MSRIAHIGRRVLLGVAAIVVVFGGAELVLRAAGFAHTPREKKLWKPTVAGFSGTYEYLIPTRFSPPGYLWVTEPNTLFTDRYGFRKPELPIQKEPGKIRIVFLGGSTTQGARTPYPERAVRLLNVAVSTTRYETLNIACAAYSTHQSVMALERWGLPRTPDIAVIYHGWNDPVVADDGYSDHEKDALVDLKIRPTQIAGFLSSLRLYEGLAWLIERADTRWPRLRVPPDRFEKNLETMLEMTRNAGIRSIVFVRPASRRRPLPPVSEVAARAYEKAGFPSEPVARYDAIHRVYSDIQRRVAARHAHAEIFDALRILDDLQARHAAGEFGEDIQIFMNDAVHIFEFAEEMLAVELACAIEPSLSARIRELVESPDYHFLLAHEFLKDDQVFEAAWHAREAIRRADGFHPEAEELLRQAESQFEFARLFREGRWGGDDEAFESKIVKLRRCQEMRPSDFGVCLQIFRVCHYMNRLPEAANAMDLFRPATPRDRHGWLLLMMQSHAAGRRWAETEAVAREILTISPADREAREMLRRIERMKRTPAALPKS